MDDLPDDVAATLARGVGAYVRTTSLADLPTALKRFKRFASTEKGLVPHRRALLSALEDEPTRALIGEWLGEKPPLPKRDVELLRLAVSRPEGWADELRGTSRGRR
ncbi:MAG TPA: hypothetical protein VHJ82_00320 [Actinomycetota bacterium]|nr:hypothetical protein [Actinomycetota bacterium]